MTLTNTRLRVDRTRHQCAPPTRSACEAACMLGVLIDDLRTRTSAAPPPIEIDLPNGGGIIALLGPSGSGKSTLLRDIVSALRADGRRVIDAVRIRLGGRTGLDHFRSGRSTAMAWLARAGLAEARCLVARANELSEGQRFRLRLALAFERASGPSPGAEALPSEPPGTAIVIDEFGSALDEPTAFGVCASLRRCVPASVRAWVILATTRGELIEPLDPDVLIRLDALGAVTIRPHDRCGTLARRPPNDRLRIEPGTRQDYDALARWHYRAGPPATIVHTLRAIDTRTSDLTGVLVVSMPVLNAMWRPLAWGDRYAGDDKARSARRLNGEVRCISRVVIDPRYRGLGAARSLVRAYLDDPLTIRTESLAAMGRVCPFFAAAGMQEWRLPPRAPDARLLDALCFAGLERWRAALPDEAWRRLDLAGKRPFVERELRVWASTSRRLLRRGDRPPSEMFEAACRRLSDGTTAYTAGPEHLAL